MTSQLMMLPGYVLVEGKNDKHVIQNLCRRHGLAITVQEPDEGGKPRLADSSNEAVSSGVVRLLLRISTRIKEPSREPIGIVVDADVDILGRWQQLRDRLLANGYLAIPESPVPTGWISSEPNLRRVGIWLMPNNQQPGILEDFVTTLIPNDDPLRDRATAILSEIEQLQLHRYPIEQRPKALIHTWLAWQEIPGQPMGLAITVRALSHDTPSAHAFIAWLRRLFDPASSFTVV